MLAKTPQHELVALTKLAPWQRALLAGADYIELRGLAKGTFVDNSGAACVVGVGWKLSWTGIPGRRPVIWEEATTRLVRFLQIAYGSLASWNDVPGRTAAEVVAAMRACAAEGDTSSR